MTTPWGLPDFDAHEDVHFVTDEKCGLKAIIAVHSTHLGPAAGGCSLLALCEGRGGADRRAAAVARDELQECDGRAAARRRQVGDPRRREPDQDARHAPRLRQGGRAARRPLRHCRGRRDQRRRHDRDRAIDEISSPACPIRAGDVGGDPGPHTSLGVFLGIKAAVKWALGKDSLNGLHIALQGAGSVATGVALHACAEGAKLSIADVDEAKAQEARRARRRQGRFARRNPGARGRRAQPLRARRDPRRAAIAAAEGSGRRRRREQPARDARRRRAAARARASSTRPITSSTPAGSSTSAPNISATATPAWSAGGSKAFRFGSSRSGPKAPRPAAIRRRSPTLWRKG